MNKVICIGSACKDIFFPTDEGVILETPEDVTATRKIAFELGAKYHISQRYETLGGCSVNVAAGLSRLGIGVACYAAVGTDAIADWIKKEIAAFGADTADVYQVEGSCSDLSAIIVDKQSGERTIFSSHGASHMLKVEAQKISGSEWIFVGDLSGEWETNLEIIVEAVKKEGQKIVFNPRQQMIHDDAEFVLDVIGMSEIALLNKDEAVEIVMNNDNLISVEKLEDEKFLLQELAKSGVHYLVITDGIRGAWATNGEQVIHAQALRHDSVVDTTGAGDAFASGFVGAILNGRNLSDAVCWGIANSSNSIRFYGGQKGLLDITEIIKTAEKVEFEKI